MATTTTDMDAVHRIGIFDAHCHPTDIMTSIPRIQHMKAKVLTVMSTRSQDQSLVSSAAETYNLTHRDQLTTNPNQRFIIPAFGWHPWFSHQLTFDDNNNDDNDNTPPDAIAHYKSVLTPIPNDPAFLSSLPPPIRISTFLEETSTRLLHFPCALVGEIGLDRSFRLPVPPDPPSEVIDTSLDPEEAYTPGTREGRPLTRYRVSMAHQKRVFAEQLRLAARLGRAVSVHSVQAHGVVFEVLSELWSAEEGGSKSQTRRRRFGGGEGLDEGKAKRYPPRICMHSYSGPRDVLRWFLGPKVPADVFFSFSEAINFAGSDKAVEVVWALPDDRILVESDLHCAGEAMDGSLEDVVRRICRIKGWKLVDGARILRRNWERFVFGE